MRRLILGSATALAVAAIVATGNVSGQGRVDSSGVMTPEGGKNPSATIQHWMRTSVGHWEGDVLVVETRNVKPESAVNGQPLSEDGALIKPRARLAVLRRPGPLSGLWRATVIPAPSIQVAPPV
jgi:hypothetical protein